MRTSSDVQASMWDVASRVCAKKGHDFFYIEHNESCSQFICRKCGMWLEEVREIAEVQHG